MRVEQLSRLMIYILGHRPDEFGLAPDAGGFVALKELLWAIREEPGWGYVRPSNINEVLLSRDRSLFEIDGDRIRVLQRNWRLNLDTPSESLPKLVYVAVRKRAHAHALGKGVKAPSGSVLLLSSEKETARRIGLRRGSDPVLLEIHAEEAQREGVPFYPFGQLFLTAEIPPRHIKGPPLPKEPERPMHKAINHSEERAQDFHPGTFALEVERDPSPSRRIRGKKAKGWKEESKKVRRRKGS